MLKRIAIISGLFLLGMSAAYAQSEVAAEANPNAPEIAFTADVLNYGTIEQGSDGNRTFTFTNTGKEPLILKNVRASCGCTTPKWTRNPVAPGEEGEIVVHYDTKRMGQFHKTITVQSNGKTGTKMLTIKGKVIPKEQVETSPEKKTTTSKVSKK